MKYKNRAIYQNDAVKTNRDEKKPSIKYCPICGEKRTHVGIKRKYLESFFIFPSICVGLETVRKCENGHYWGKTWVMAQRVNQ